MATKPICPYCGATAVYRPKRWQRPAYYGCPQFMKKHPSKPWIVLAVKWDASRATT